MSIAAPSPSPVNSASTAQAAAAVPWTCPFCVLLCDSASLAVEDGRYVMLGCDCPSARKALKHFDPGVPSTAVPRVGAADATLAAAIEEAAKRLVASKQPLFGGLATDVDGARALYPLACATGAIYDAAGGASQLHGLRALQDRGAFTTTLAEVRNRADLIVCIGGSPGEALPDVWRRFGIGEDGVAQREVVVVGAPADAALAGRPRTTASSVALQGDLFDTVSTLTALVAQRRVPASDDLTTLATRLRAARYAVIVWESARLPEHGALIVESLNALVATLNRSTRAASFPISGKDGLSSVNYTFTWLSGMALRSRVGPLGLEHEPLRFDATRLLAEGSVDALLWVSCFGPEPALPSTSLPCVVLGHPATQVPDDAVFIPVATPGIGAPGHMFRADGGVVLPLNAVQDDGLPGLPEVLKAITKRVLELKS